MLEPRGTGNQHTCPRETPQETPPQGALRWWAAPWWAGIITKFHLVLNKTPINESSSPFLVRLLH